MTPEQEDLLVAGMMFLGVGVVVGWAGTFLWYGMKRMRGPTATPPLLPGPQQGPVGADRGAAVPDESADKRPAPAVVRGQGWVLIQWHCPRCGKIGRACRCPVNVPSRET
jgi:hypothetical protein